MGDDGYREWVGEEKGLKAELFGDLVED